MMSPKPRNIPSIQLLLIATRPAFLSVTVVAVLLGYASAVYGGYIMDYPSAALTFVFALVAHAGANVINDYHDALNGCDFAESDRIFPFTGGSQMIQNGLLSQNTMRIFGYWLLLSVVPVGIWLTAQSGLGLMLIGALGLLIGWAYSAPPLKLQSRGLGEWTITTGWLLVVMGSDYVQRHGFSWMPVAIGLGFALLVTNILFINQFPDVRADSIAYKRTIVIRLGASRARWGYIIIAALCCFWLCAMVLLQILPALALWALSPMALSFLAFRDLMHHANQPAQLKPAIQLTIASALAHGLILMSVLAFS
ncbi:MAG: menA, 1,4-dihydroxy-2-naphthoate octaprenyltransferase [Burkholderiaceae bacterium]|nr:menA, 1,4-dihydroxy-2-naphthoate octaprenyltransferase [Burkholderiaceae bacterium]